MPIQAPQWTDYLNCPVCCREFGPSPRSPISLGCGHTLCRHCLKHLHRKQCPYDQTVIQVDLEELVVNTALLQLAGYSPPAQPYHPPCIQALPEADQQAYDVIVRSMEHLAVYLKYCGNVNTNMGSRLSRPMQRKLVTLLQCAMTDEEGRGRAARAARSLGERTVTELILQHQNSQQLSANLWAAVRARGCQFLGPAMQEEVLKLVLLALEDGSALSRKVLVMFVVQRLEPHFPQASKTSIGHVVQLLYRASCFKVSKRECDSSLMQLKEEFRTYESLRREHDAQIVQIATEAGLRIAPDQWSALLYGDTTHKSHMQSIIDKLQTPQSFAQSVQELFIALQRTGDPAQLGVMSMHLDRLASIDASPDAKSPSWKHLAEVMTSLKEVVSRLIHYLQQQATGRDTNHNQKYPQERCSEPSTSQPSPQTAASTPTHTKYKISMCRDAATRSFCPRGNTCTFAHSEEELERYRAMPNTNPSATNGNYTYIAAVPSTMPMPPPMPSMALSQNMYPRFPLPQHPPHPHLDNYSHPPSMPTLPNQGLPPEMLPNPEYQPEPPHNIEGIPPTNYASSIIHNQTPMGMNQNGIMIPVPERPYYGRFSGILTIHEEPTNNMQYPRPEFTNTVFPPPAQNIPYQAGEQNLAPPMANIFVPVQHESQRNISPYPFDDLPSEDYLLSDYRVKPTGFTPVPLERRPETTWPPGNDLFHFDNMRNAISHCSTNPEDMFNVTGDRRAVGADRLAVGDRLAVATTSDLSNRADDQELEEELQALERRIDTEFKSAD
ncbi:RING finger and CCCH-type zinc finger domain-containing protein roquin [Aphomia sociella]